VFKRPVSTLTYILYNKNKY